MNIMNMLTRLLMRQAMNWATRKGSSARARRGGVVAGGAAKPKSAAERKVQTDNRKNVKRARMAARMARRMMR
ncbi:hypothetical protein GI374_10205 [Paracoccus sp. S-4012]|uniref:hypothetical protein n=1 Tax=Paracoccus sp. S-4012 TaxID=2665648 RepID=UPI0012AEE1D1|nr:hypothetical protein [Paracoccus sp. S-4012]MRX50811.1 hypothetical protein [Paracoccus sp. S-4012]